MRSPTFFLHLLIDSSFAKNLILSISLVSIFLYCTSEMDSIRFWQSLSSPGLSASGRRIIPGFTTADSPWRPAMQFPWFARCLLPAQSGVCWWILSQASRCLFYVQPGVTQRILSPVPRRFPHCPTRRSPPVPSSPSPKLIQVYNSSLLLISLVIIQNNELKLSPL